MHFTELKGTPLAAVNQNLDNIIKMAMKELDLTMDKLTIRTLRPEDVGLSTSEWTFNLSATGENSDQINQTIADSRFVLIYGVKISQSVAQVSTRVKITRESKEAREWNVQGVNLTQDSQIFFADPVTINQNTGIQVDIFTNTTNAAEKLGLIGCVVEKKGLVFG